MRLFLFLIDVQVIDVSAYTLKFFIGINNKRIIVKSYGLLLGYKP